MQDLRRQSACWRSAEHLKHPCAIFIAVLGTADIKFSDLHVLKALTSHFLNTILISVIDILFLLFFFNVAFYMGEHK